ncbi:MAG: GNAT family N-acetyltransferase [Treponema sp.]|nr:GNAT family N-acetyltransferase [Treponema sp.]
MLRRNLNKSRWRKVPKEDRHIAEAFFRLREKYCVAASARFRLMQNRGHLWHLSAAGGDFAALLLHSRQSLFPVFDKNPRVPGPRFLNRFLGRVPIYSLQGLREDAELLEELMESQGYFAAERIDYELMSLDDLPKAEALKAGPEALVLRPPEPKDSEQLFALQSAYEQEEVLPKKAVFNPAACRLGLDRMIASELVLLAELNGQVVGKINTSAESFTRYQIGGVYVRPDCRGQGIAAKMTAVFTRKLLSQGKGISLFVKKQNKAAIKAYRKTGFCGLADYRISYF